MCMGRICEIYTIRNFLSVFCLPFSSSHIVCCLLWDTYTSKMIDFFPQDIIIRQALASLAVIQIYKFTLVGQLDKKNWIGIERNPLITCGNDSFSS